MRTALLLLAAILVSIGACRADAQPAHVGRLSLFALPPAGKGSCRTEPASAALRRDGISRLISLQWADSTGHGLMSLGLNAAGAPRMLVTMSGTRHERRGETESASIFFRSDGKIARGRRSAFTTGTPARLSDDRRLGLLPTDSAAAKRLAAALRQRCHA